MRSAAEVQRELQQREEARNNVKLIWRALAAMVSGISPLLSPVSSVVCRARRHCCPASVLLSQPLLHCIALHLLHSGLESDISDITVVQQQC